MPESGVLRFTMNFPPIPSTVNCIDFTEDIPDGWAIWDIDLTGTDNPDKYMADMPAKLRDIDPDGMFPPMEFKFDTTTVRVHVMGYRPEMGDKLSWGGQYSARSGSLYGKQSCPDRFYRCRRNESSTLFSGTILYLPII